MLTRKMKAKVVTLFKKGMMNVDIADKLGLCPKVVSAIVVGDIPVMRNINTKRIPQESIALVEKFLKVPGYKPADIAYLSGVSVATVYRVRRGVR